MKLYKDRIDAGRQLAGRLLNFAGRDDVIIMALPRGGVPVGFEVAGRLNAPLDVFVVRKLGVPYEEELAMGAIASGDVLVLNEDIFRMINIPRETVERIAAQERTELERRERLYRGDRPRPDVEHRAVILVDDGMATGASMRAAIAALKILKPAWIVVAVPVAPAETCDAVGEEVDEIICDVTPDRFMAVGAWYEDFAQVSDREVRDLLDQAASSLAA